MNAVIVQPGQAIVSFSFSFWRFKGIIGELDL
jgi:hypothetical protein